MLAFFDNFWCLTEAFILNNADFLSQLGSKTLLSVFSSPTREEFILKYYFPSNRNASKKSKQIRHRRLLLLKIVPFWRLPAQKTPTWWLQRNVSRQVQTCPDGKHGEWSLICIGFQSGFFGFGRIIGNFVIFSAEYWPSIDVVGLDFDLLPKIVMIICTISRPKKAFKMLYSSMMNWSFNQVKIKFLLLSPMHSGLFWFLAALWQNSQVFWG